MRIYNKNYRIKLSRENENKLFTEELDYYRTNNQYPVSLFEKKIINIYKNINLQILVTNRCNLKCKFCIERSDDCDTVSEKNPLSILTYLLSQYNFFGIYPNISITGGEPSLDLEYLHNIINLINKYEINHLNINSNGTFLDPIQFLHINLNISRHHYNNIKNNDIFGKDRGMYYNRFYNNDFVNFQCVLLDGYIDSIDEIKKYTDLHIKHGIKRVTFRGLSNLNTDKGYYEESIEFCNNQTVDVFKILNDISEDKDFEFIQQKIGDHYIYELYKYKGITVCFSYSNFAFLKNIENEERQNGKLFSRATILKPDGSVYIGWYYEINKIL